MGNYDKYDELFMIVINYTAVIIPHACHNSDWSTQSKIVNVILPLKSAHRSIMVVGIEITNKTDACVEITNYYTAAFCWVIAVDCISLGVGSFHVHLRFHPTDVKWNLGLHRNF